MLTMCMGFGCNAAGVIGCRIIDSWSAASRVDIAGYLESIINDRKLRRKYQSSPGFFLWEEE